METILRGDVDSPGIVRQAVRGMLEGFAPQTVKR
jgi:hypothetical protein